jgi:hypothetical protein
MTRKLLPYEHDLIATLGCTKEEYLEFLSLQEEYNDIKAGSVLDIRNDPATVSIVLTVIGIIFQVASALLMPRPQIPSVERTGDVQTREQRFAPRFGFNSAQEVAKYGDVIPIVYTDITTNPNGGVRITSSMIWSAIRSYGQNQYMQMLAILSGGAITAIDANKSAFGQTAITDLVAQNKWIYFRPSGTGALAFQNETSNNSATDPARYGNATDNPYRLQIDNSLTRYDGFSQVYSPSSSNTFGGYSPVPFAVYFYLRDSENNKFGEFVDIFLDSFGFDYAVNGHTLPFQPSNNLGLIPVGAGVRLWIAPTSETGLTLTDFNLQFYRAKADVRRAVASQFDDAGIFKLGSALFRVTSIEGDSPDNGNYFVNLTCIEAGRSPSVRYSDVEVTPDNSGFYNLKALVRVESASYTSLSRCHIIDFAFRCQVFRRIGGRQASYGYSASDNGLAQRHSMFLMFYRIDGGDGTTAGAWNMVNGIFVVRRAAEQDNYVYIKLVSSVPYNWEVKFEPVVDPVAEIRKHPSLLINGAAQNTQYLYLENTGPDFSTPIATGITLNFTGYVKTVTQTAPLPPYPFIPGDTREWDWFSLDADTDMTCSFDRGPEFTLVAVTEQQRQTFDLTRLYKNLSLLGFNVFSGKGLQDLRSFTAFVTRGKPVRVINTNTLTVPSAPTGPSNYAPDIFLDTVYDKEDGIGNYAAVEGIDLTELAYAKRFCVANNLFLDGVIADRTSWRAFWAANAPFSLLEFARIGGKETLIPAVPYDRATGAMNRRVHISALFNQGNILENSYKEEYMDYDANVQDLIATVIYRALDSICLFAVNRSISISRSDITENDAVIQTFDISAYVTSEAQAIMFGKLLCNTRRYVRNSIEFKTFPTTSPVMPGTYIYVDLGQNQWDGIYTGVIAAGGLLNTPVAGSVPDGTYSILLYRSGDGVISTTVTIANNTAASLSTREGWLFVLGQEVRRKRVYRVNEVQMDEEGEVTVRATIYPCDSSDRSLIADFTDQLFTIRR